MTKSIATIIVTHNRSAKLRKSIRSVLNQHRMPDVVYIIDNASTDNTKDVVASFDHPSLTYVGLEQNTGGAGGFFAGINLAYLNGHDLFWLMDDDSYPSPDALGVLEASLITHEARSGHRPSFACSSVRWVDGDLCEMNTPSPVWDWPRFYSPDFPAILVESCSFVSVLVPNWSVEMHGLPIKEFFIWYDDVEFTKRVSRSYPGIYCLNSVVVHDIPENKGVNYELINEQNIWKYKYGVRNTTYTIIRDQGYIFAFVYIVDLYMRMSRSSQSWKTKWSILRAWFSGVWFSPKIVWPK